jgi:hypothetical protein
MKRLLPHSAKLAGGLGIVALGFSILWLSNIRLVGHYEVYYGPGWQIGIAVAANATGLVLAFAATLEKVTWKRLLLTGALALLSVPIFFLALVQLLEQPGLVQDIIWVLTEQALVLQR